MTRTCALIFVASLAVSCSSAPPERQIIDDAAAALGGASRIQSLTALQITGSGSAPNAGQNRMPDDELPVWKVTEHSRAIDLANGRTRVQQFREAQFQFAGATTQRVTQGLDGAVAYNATPDGTMTRAGDAAARDRRIELLHHPIMIVRAAMDPAAKLTNPRTDGGTQSVDITTALGDTLTLTVDQATHLPSKVTSMADNANMGDVAIVTTFGDYQEVGGVKLPRRLTTMMDKYLQFDLQVSKNAVNGNVADLAVPDTVKSAAAPTPPPVVVTVEPVAKGIWWLAGSGNHRSIVFEFDDHLVLYEVPVNEARSKAVIDKARTLSTKPLTTAIVSHHHFDHSGGLRVAVAEDLTIVTANDVDDFVGVADAAVADDTDFLTAISVETAGDANDTIVRVDAALTSVSSLRSTLGAIQNRFESTITNLTTAAENLTASRSRIQDADFAQETAALTRAQILQQAGTAILAQANAVPQNVLSLLR